MAFDLRRARAAWRYRGRERPPFATAPGPGQESVWDYPRPPAIEPVSRAVRVLYRGTLLASSDRALRVVETASPPTVYVPPADVRFDRLTRGRGSSHCEWKGAAVYWSLAEIRPEHGSPDPDPVERGTNVGWSYPNPYPEFETLRDFVSFYPARVECWLGDERVRPQPGAFYGGWVTSELVGPFKGEPGSEGW